MLIPSTITARRTRRYTSTRYIHPTAHKHDFEPMDGRGRYIFQPPQCQAVDPSRWSTLPPPFTLLRGLEKVDREWLLICAGHNLLKLFRFGAGPTTKARGNGPAGRVKEPPRTSSGEIFRRLSAPLLMALATMAIASQYRLLHRTI